METFAKEFEQYILSDFREESLTTLIPGGASQKYFELCKRLNDFEKQDQEELHRDIKAYAQKDYGLDCGNRLLLLFYMKSYDNEIDPEKKKKMLEMINSKFNIFQERSFPKPNKYHYNADTESTENVNDALNEDIFDYHKIVDKFYKVDRIEQDSIKQLEEKYLSFMVDLTKLSDFALLDLLDRNYSHPLNTCLKKLYLYHENSGLLERFTKLMKTPNFVSYAGANNFLQSIHNYMTTSQIEKFLKIVPENFIKDFMINELLNRKFTSALFRSKDNFSKRKILLEIYEFLKDKSLKYNSLKSDNILHILENGILTNIYDLKLFKEFLENPTNSNSFIYNFDRNKILKLNEANSIRQQLCNMQNKSENEENTLILKYLKYFFLFEEYTPNEFLQYLKRDILVKEYNTSLILKGEESEELIQFISKDDALIKSVEIKICEHNKELFKLNEDIEITVDIKNVQTLFVKIFEINTENYYYNKKETINSALSLEGLIATYEDTYSFSDKPQVLVRRNFKFDKIPNKRGIFIIELIGNGYSSRAIIKKGSLSVVSRSTPNGNIFYVLDEDQKICKGNRTGIWVKNELYKSNLHTGAIIIPYQKSYSIEKAILIHEDFAELTQINLETEEYRLEASYIFNKESFLMGNVAKILIKPFLFVNNRLTDPKFLSNLKVTVNLTKIDNLQEIPISNVFDNSNLFKEKLLNNEEIEVEFQIPPKLTKIFISLDAEVENKSQEKKNSLQSRKIINIDSLGNDMQPNTSNNHFKIFLRVINKNYYATVLCKNGEPQSNLEVEFKFIHSYVNLKDSQSILRTNKNGEICLGKLENVQIVYAVSNSIGGEIKEVFFLKSGNHIGYPSNLDLIEGEKLQLPVTNDILNTMYLVSYDIFKVVENLTGLLKVNSYTENSSSNNEYNRYKYISLENLSEGTYKLGLGDSEITINIHKGKFWKSDEYIITNDRIIENNSNKFPIHLQNFEVSNLFNDINLKEDNKNDESQDKLQSVKIKVSSNTSNPRVHLFAYKFIQNIEGFSAGEISTILSKGRSSNDYLFQQWKNMYLSNRLLNEEIQYVLDRKYYERFIGNSLDKPSLLVKRQFVRDTTTEIIEAKEGTNFARVHAKMALAQKCLAYDKLCSESNFAGGDFNSWNLGYERDFTYIKKQLEENASTFHNFLACSPLILTNLKPDENREIILKLDLTNYSVLHALVIDDRSAYEDTLYLPFSDVAKRDLRMTVSLDPQKNFSEIRKTSVNLKEGSHTITDITSTKFQIIDSIEKYISYFMLSANFNRLQKDFNDLSFLTKFDELEENEKLKKLSNYFCHEVNIYLYFKHQDFFLLNVRPVLKYKSEKTFVDFFLLEDLPKIREFTTANRITRLNSFEKCLLIYAIRRENPELANIIAKNLRNEAELSKISAEEMKRLFNIIINMRIESEIDKLEEKVISLQEPQREMLFAARSMASLESMPMKRGAPMMKKAMMKERKINVQNNLFDVGQEEVEVANVKSNITKEGGKSKEYCETHYYNNNSKDFKYFIKPNGFYADLAEFWANDKNINHSFSNGFVSSNIILPIESIPQLFSTISVLDLPTSRITSHQFKRLEGRGLEIVANSNMIIFTKEISETSADIRSNLMIAQIVNKQNLNEYDNNAEDIFEKFTEERENDMNEINSNYNKYITNEVYKHETIVTNVSNKTLTFELLINIPEGSLPVHGSDYTNSINLTLNKFQTNKIDTFFYFSRAGKFIQFSPSASIEGVVVAKTQPLYYEVYECLQKQSHSTLEDVLESGTKQEILQFLKKSDNLSSDKLSKIYWLLNDTEFYKELLKILKSKGIYDSVIWSFSFKNNEQQTLREYIESETDLRFKLGALSDFSLIKIDAHNNYNIMNHLDYHPLLNSRAHRLCKNKSKSIYNKELRKTYEEFINYLISLKEIDNKNYLRLTYYLLIQDRIEEAFKIFQRIDPNSFDSLASLGLQYDYISAYIDFSLGYPGFSVAREICNKYKEFPLKHWRELFEEIEDQLLEYDGKQSFDDLDRIIDEEKQKKLYSKLALETEPKLSFTVENKTLNILYSNIESVIIKFYLIDLEILFSRTPFIQQNSDDFSFVQPNFINTTKVEKSTGEKILSFSIPPKYTYSNLFIEVSSHSKKSFNTHFSTSLIVNISEGVGEVKVLNSNLKPLTKVYVKCFAKHEDDSIKFYKDGYTDLRGRFNYISLNSDSINNIKRFALFIMDDELGSLIKEANPPANIDSFTYGTEDKTMQNAYDNYMNYRQEIKSKWKSQK